MKKISLICLSVVFIGCASSSQDVLVNKPSGIELLKPKYDKNDKDVDPKWIGRILDVKGKLEVKRYEDHGGDVAISFMANIDQYIKTHDVLETFASGEAELKFNDGTKIIVAPSTVLKVENYNVIDDITYIKLRVLSGSIRSDVSAGSKKVKLEVHTPNVAVSSSRADFIVKHASDYKSTKIACFYGSLTYFMSTDSKTKNIYDGNIEKDEYVVVDSIYDGAKEIYVSRDPVKIKRAERKELVESFSSDPQEVDPWEYTTISTGLLRFITGFEYSKFKEISERYYSWYIGYTPLVYLGYIIYLEPYFELAFARPFSMTFFRTGGRIELQLYKGLYLGFGGGAFWVSRDVGEAGLDLGFNAGYTFAEKPLDFIDGIRFSYNMSKSSGYNNRAFLIGIMMNFYNGRGLY